MADKTPGQIQPGTASDGSFVHATQADDNLSHRHDETNISRLRSAINAYDMSKTYEAGDLVIENGTLFRANDTTTGTFDVTKWDIADGVGAKNVKQIFSQADFPTPVNKIIEAGQSATSVIPLDDGVQYIISEPITLTLPLFIDTGFEVSLTSFADHKNKITYTGSENLFNTLTGSGGIFGTSYSNPDLTITITAGEAADVVVGTNINLKLIEDNVELSALPIASKTNTTIVVTVGAVNPTTVSNSGFWDQGPKILELQDLCIVGTQSVNAYSLFLDHASTSKFFVFNVTLEDFFNIGETNNAGQLHYNCSMFSKVNGGWSIFQSQRTFLNQLSFLNKTSGADDDITFGGSLVEFLDVNSCVFESFPASNPTSKPFLIASTFAFFIPLTAVVNIANCSDINFQDSMFSTAGSAIDETDRRLFVQDNGQQKNSEYRNGMELTGTQTITNTLGSNVNFIPVLGNWVNYDFERFSSDVNGIITYTGLEDITIKVDHRITFEPDNGQNNNTLKAVIALNPDGVFNFRITNVGTNYADGTVGVTIAGPPGLGDTAMAFATASGGSIVSITLTDPGSGYDTTSPPAVTIDAPPPVGTTATAIAFLGDPVLRTESVIHLDNTDPESAAVGIGLINLQSGDQIQLQVLMNKIGDFDVGPANVVLHRSG